MAERTSSPGGGSGELAALREQVAALQEAAARLPVLEELIDGLTRAQATLQRDAGREPAAVLALRDQQQRNSQNIAAVQSLLHADAVIATAFTQKGFHVGDPAITDVAASKLTGDLALGSSQQVGFFGAAATAQQTAGALTNNLTATGTPDTLTDWTPSGVYADDQQALYDAIANLAHKVGQLTTGVRTIGLFT